MCSCLLRRGTTLTNHRTTPSFLSSLPLLLSSCCSSPVEPHQSRDTRLVSLVHTAKTNSSLGLPCYLPWPVTVMCSALKSMWPHFVFITFSIQFGIKRSVCFLFFSTGHEFQNNTYYVPHYCMALTRVFTGKKWKQAGTSLKPAVLMNELQLVNLSSVTNWTSLLLIWDEDSRSSLHFSP